jgi:hypothetical protein
VKKTLSLLVALAGLSWGAPVITVIPSVGPSSLSTLSGSAAAYEANALVALWQGASSFGSAGTPTLYSQLSGALAPNQMIDTIGVFNSWLGMANPSTPFAEEFGNNLYFGLRILGGTESFSLSQLVYDDNLATIDPSLIGTTPFSFNGDTYDSRFLAFLDNGSTPGVLDAGDTMVPFGTDGSTPVNYLFYVGVSAFFGPLQGNTAQEALDNTIAAIGANAPLTFTASYCLAATAGDLTCGDATGRASATIGGDIPEPSTYGLMGLGLAALAYFRRRLVAKN